MLVFAVCNLALTSICGHVRLGEWKTLLLLINNPIQATMSTMFMGSFEMTEIVMDKADFPQNYHPTYLITECLLSSLPFDEHLYETWISLHPLTLLRNLSTSSILSFSTLL